MLAGRPPLDPKVKREHVKASRKRSMLAIHPIPPDKTQQESSREDFRRAIHHDSTLNWTILREKQCTIVASNWLGDYHSDSRRREHCGRPSRCGAGARALEREHNAQRRGGHKCPPRERRQPRGGGGGGRGHVAAPGPNASTHLLPVGGGPRRAGHAQLVLPRVRVLAQLQFQSFQLRLQWQGVQPLEREQRELAGARARGGGGEAGGPSARGRGPAPGCSSAREREHNAPRRRGHEFPQREGRGRRGVRDGDDSGARARILPLPDKIERLVRGRAAPASPATPDPPNDHPRLEVVYRCRLDRNVELLQTGWEVAVFREMRRSGDRLPEADGRLPRGGDGGGAGGVSEKSHLTYQRLTKPDRL
ncbi:hypothetical protein FB451DRAFT_1173177 [Mycena latifolia]|nr:hypothetical protein FB451DRAFT_1173177 [Mycena latifolia]